DGIRAPLVTGVQTCALPICLLRLLDVMRQPRQLFGDVSPFRQQNQLLGDALLADVRVNQAGNLLYALPEPGDHLLAELVAMLGRSEERREGKRLVVVACWTA